MTTNCRVPLFCKMKVVDATQTYPHDKVNRILFMIFSMNYLMLAHSVGPNFYNIYRSPIQFRCCWHCTFYARVNHTGIRISSGLTFVEKCHNSFGQFCRRVCIHFKLIPIAVRCSLLAACSVLTFHLRCFFFVLLHFVAFR